MPSVPVPGLEREFFLDAEDVLPVLVFVGDLVHAFLYQVDAEAAGLAFLQRGVEVGVLHLERVVGDTLVDEGDDDAQGRFRHLHANAGGTDLRIVGVAGDVGKQLVDGDVDLRLRLHGAAESFQFRVYKGRHPFDVFHCGVDG